MQASVDRSSLQDVLQTTRAAATLAAIASRKPRDRRTVRSELWACAAVGLTLRTRRAAVHERDLGSAHEGIEHVRQRADDHAFPLVVLLVDHACRGGTVLGAREAVVPDAETLDCTHAEWTRRSARHSADVSDSGRRLHGIPTADREWRQHCGLGRNCRLTPRAGAGQGGRAGLSLSAASARLHTHRTVTASRSMHRYKCNLSTTYDVK